MQTSHRVDEISRSATYRSAQTFLAELSTFRVTQLARDTKDLQSSARRPTSREKNRVYRYITNSDSGGTTTVPVDLRVLRVFVTPLESVSATVFPSATTL